MIWLWMADDRNRHWNLIFHMAIVRTLTVHIWVRNTAMNFLIGNILISNLWLMSLWANKKILFVHFALVGFTLESLNLSSKFTWDGSFLTSKHLKSPRETKQLKGLTNIFPATTFSPKAKSFSFISFPMLFRLMLNADGTTRSSGSWIGERNVDVIF